MKNRQSVKREATHAPAIEAMVCDAAERAATDMGLPRAALKITVAACAHLPPGYIAGTAHFGRSLVRVRYAPGACISEIDALSLLYHEVGHLVDRAGYCRGTVLVTCRTATALSALIASNVTCLAVGVAALDRIVQGQAESSAMPTVLAALLATFLFSCYVGLGAAYWCDRWALWHTWALRGSHARENTANRLAVDALLARRDAPGVAALAAMLSNLRRHADRGQKVARGHPPARDELRALVDHLLCAHGLRVVFGPDEGLRCRRRLHIRWAVDDRLLYDGTFDPLRERTRRYRRHRRRTDDPCTPSLFWCLVLGGGRDIAAGLQRLVAYLSALKDSK